MAREMFGDVVEPSIKVGSQMWYTVPVSIIVHTAIIGAVIIIGAGFYIFLREQQLGREETVVNPPA